ncbi:hypothetical protein Moror_6448 [Moniliophthora roreri MCA 2997]|uniref:FIST domain-containing protein n=2 Tax=Moniliophthora roreri TaxID=221103 RepID=V2XWD0_MONRO|nr:hypothetical protein Moror_6448 [Moniliophthora roreri MCA 2997]KAI3610498.1 hypothetical protein WG66_007088 [Moniliophthora roreri]
MASFAATIISRSPSSISSYLTRLKTTRFNPSKHSFLFTLSPPTPSSQSPELDSSADLASLVNVLTSFSTTSLGCLSAPLTWSMGTEKMGYNPISCSVALLDKEHCVLFRSTIPGRAQTQVGRWHAFRMKDEDEFGGHWDDFEMLTSHSEKGVNWEEVWSEGADAKKDWSVLPEGLMKLKPTPDAVRQFLLFSDPSPEGLVSTLHSTFSHASQLGLYASSTPFITGRPVTLFENGRIHGSGAVGVGFINTDASGLRLKLPNGLTPLGSEMLVTKAEGNLINTLDNSNPTRLLLEAIRQGGIDATSEDAVLFKEDEEFYLSVGAGSQIYNITSGDPSRGTIALNTTRAPSVGEKVQFYHRNKKVPSPSLISSGIVDAFRSEALFAFGVADIFSGEKYNSDNEDPYVMENVFLTASENGLWAGRDPLETPWTCTVPGCVVRSQI